MYIAAYQKFILCKFTLYVWYYTVDKQRAMLKMESFQFAVIFALCCILHCGVDARALSK